MFEIARAAIAQTPPQCRVTAAHAQVIERHADALLGLGPGVVQSFYDTLYQHDPTAQVFLPDERPMREQTLVDWWERTVRGPIDDSYWAWMSMVGLIHVIRHVTNPMMLAMADFVAGYVADHAAELQLSPEETGLLVDAFRRVAAMTGSVITWGYDHAVSAALFEVAGMPEQLLARLRDAEVRVALVEARAELAN